MTQANRDLEGWEGIPGNDLHLNVLVDLAFNYRGNVTIVTNDGDSIVGYVSNRDCNATNPYLQIFDEAGNGPIAMAYGAIDRIIFTGKNPAKGNSYADYLKRKDQPGKLADDTYGLPEANVSSTSF
jgi:hypothetical protein